MKINKIETIELREGAVVHAGTIGWLWVRILTDEGHWGLGETYPASSSEKAVILNDIAPRLLGRDPRDIESIWHDLFLAVQYRGWAGAEIRAISAVDVALWDLMGRAANLPVYRLLGGKCWDNVRVYNTCYDDTFDFLKQPVDLARDLYASGIRALKIWPFDEIARRNHGQSISASELEEGLAPVREMCEALQEKMEIAVEFHGLWNLPCAIKIARALEPYKVMWLEELLPQDNLAAYQTLAQRVSSPLCISERLMTRWGFREILENGAASVIMPDVAWCGGLSEARKIANWAETYYLPIAPHNCGGPVTHFATWHLAVATPNLMIMETVRRHYADRFVPIATSSGAVEGGRLESPPGPGLGVDLRTEFLKSPKVLIDVFPADA
jgi:galactonate dehydratase